MAIRIGWKLGVEIETMAPRGGSRRDLADAVAAARGGRVRRFFHPQSEPSAVKGRTAFENVTPGFEVRDAGGRWVASFVDDLTLQAGLNRNAAPQPGWYRVVADDARLLRLLMRHCDAEAQLETALAPFADLFGVEPERHPGGMVRIADGRNATICVGAPLPGERERPCEIVTAPIEEGHHAALERLLEPARALGFVAPDEGATHLHFDAGPMRSAPAVAALVEAVETHGAVLKRLLGVNPRCVRLGPWPPALRELTRSDRFRGLDWPAAREALAGVGLGKYCDVNLLNLAVDHREKPTIEFRTLPTHLDARPIVEAAALIEALLRWCLDPSRSAPGPDAQADAFFAALPMDRAAARIWAARFALSAPPPAG